MAERTTNDLFGLVPTVTLLGYSDGVCEIYPSHVMRHLERHEVSRLSCDTNHESRDTHQMRFTTMQMDKEDRGEKVMQQTSSGSESITWSWR